MVGMTLAIRVSSVMRSPSSGTLKSARRKTRRPDRSSWSTVSFATGTRKPGEGPLQRASHVPDQIPHTAGVAPFVVVPGQHLDQIPVHHGGRWQVYDRRVRVAIEVHGDEFFVGGVENALEAPPGG